MSKTRKIPDRDLKLLWGLSAARCAFPDCRTECVVEATEQDAHAVIGKIAHIFAHSNSGPRANPKLADKERDSYANWILLCGNHHDVVDKQPNTYTADDLISWKNGHETWVREQLSEVLPNVGFAELEIITKAILSLPVEPTESLQLIPPKAKIQKNSLSSMIEQFILMGMVKTREVEQFIRDVSKTVPTFPEQISNGFVFHYTKLRADGVTGDQLFEEMWYFASGGNSDFMKRSAGLAVLVYLFEKCEVFEK